MNWNNRIVGHGNVPVDDVNANPANWRIHPKAQQDALTGVLETVGWVQDVIVNQRTGHLVDGHLRCQVAARNGEKTIPVVYVDLSEDEEALILATIDPLAAMAATDRAKLDDLLHQVQSDDERVRGLMSSIADKERILSVGDNETDDAEEFNRYSAPDALWASDNDWGVPLLDLSMQATSLVAPFECWGASERKRRMSGTWHFYTEDYRYEALWKDPSPILNTGAAAVVEPNWSCYVQMPPAVALWQIYRKRWMARWWQSYGIRVFVDLNVAEPHYELNLLGVPPGWKAWATRGYNSRVGNTEQEYRMAVDHAATESILFVVYGGGKLVKQAAQSNGWIYFDEVMNGGKDG